MPIEDSSRYRLAYEKNDIQKCILSDDFPIWKMFECYVNEKYKANLDSSKLALHIYSNNKETVVEPNILFRTRYHYTIMSAQDTTKGYNLPEAFDLWGGCYEYPSQIIGAPHCSYLFSKIGCYGGFGISAYDDDLDKRCYKRPFY